MEVQLWVCPNGHYWGSSSFEGRDLNAEPNYETSMRHSVGDIPMTKVVSHRGDCMICSTPRKLISVEIDMGDVFPELVDALLTPDVAV